MAEKKHSRDITMADAVVTKGTPLRRSTRLSSASTPATQLEVVESLTPKNKMTEETIGVRRSRRLSQSKTATPDSKSTRKVVTRRASTNEFSTAKTGPQDSSESESASRPLPRRCASESPTSKKPAFSSRTPDAEMVATRRSARLSTGRSPNPVKQLWTAKVRKNLESVCEDPSEVMEVNSSPTSTKSYDKGESPDVGKFNGKESGISPIHIKLDENNQILGTSKSETLQNNINAEDKQDDVTLNTVFNKQSKKINQLMCDKKSINESSFRDSENHSECEYTVNNSDMKNQEIPLTNDTPKSQQVKNETTRTPSDKHLQKQSHFSKIEPENRDNDSKVIMNHDADSVNSIKDDSSALNSNRSKANCNSEQSSVHALSQQLEESSDSLSTADGDSWLCLTMDDNQKEQPKLQSSDSGPSVDSKLLCSLNSLETPNRNRHKESAYNQELDTVETFKVKGSQNTDEEKENNSFSTNIDNGVTSNRNVTQDSLINKSSFQNAVHKNAISSPATCLSSPKCPSSGNSLNVKITPNVQQYLPSLSKGCSDSNAGDAKDEVDKKSGTLNTECDELLQNGDNDYPKVTDISSSDKTSSNCDVSMTCINSDNSDDDDIFSEGSLSYSSDKIRSPAFNKSLKRGSDISKAVREMQENNSKIKSLNLQSSPLGENCSTLLGSRSDVSPVRNSQTSGTDDIEFSCSVENADSLELQHSITDKPKMVDACTTDETNNIEEPVENVSQDSSQPPDAQCGNTLLETEVKRSTLKSNVGISNCRPQSGSSKQTKQSNMQHGQHPSEVVDVLINSLNCSSRKSLSESERRALISTGEGKSTDIEQHDTDCVEQLQTDSVIKFKYDDSVANTNSPKPQTGITLGDSILNSKPGSKRKSSEMTRHDDKNLCRQLTEDEESPPKKIIKSNLEPATLSSSSTVNKNVGMPTREFSFSNHIANPKGSPKNNKCCERKKECEMEHTTQLSGTKENSSTNDTGKLSQEPPEEATLYDAQPFQEEASPLKIKDQLTAKSNYITPSVEFSPHKEKHDSNNRSSSTENIIDVNTETLETSDLNEQSLDESRKVYKEAPGKKGLHDVELSEDKASASPTIEKNKLKLESDCNTPNTKSKRKEKYLSSNRSSCYLDDDDSDVKTKTLNLDEHCPAKSSREFKEAPERQVLPNVDLCEDKATPTINKNKLTLESDHNPANTKPSKHQEKHDNSDKLSCCEETINVETKRPNFEEHCPEGSGEVCSDAPENDAHLCGNKVRSPKNKNKLKLKSNCVAGNITSSNHKAEPIRSSTSSKENVNGIVTGIEERCPSKTTGLSKETCHKVDLHVAQYLSRRNIEEQRRQQDISVESENSNADNDASIRSDYANEYIDDMAEEGEEDSEVDDSNDIPVVGESVGYSSSEDVDPDESYEKDSFIDDEEYTLLSDNEGEISVENQSDDHGRGDIPPSSTGGKKWSRIIQVDSSSEEETTDGAGISDTSTKVMVGSCRKKTKQSSPESCDNISHVKEADEASTISTPQHPTRTSITVQENISVKEIQDESLRVKINDVVDMFHKCKSSQGEITLNVSLNYTVAGPTGSTPVVDPGRNEESLMPPKQSEQHTCSSSSGEGKKKRRRNRKRKSNGTHLYKESPTEPDGVSEPVTVPEYQIDRTEKTIGKRCIASVDDEHPPIKKIKTQSKDNVHRLKSKPVVDNLLLHIQKQAKKQKPIICNKESSACETATFEIAKCDDTSIVRKRKKRAITVSTSSNDPTWLSEVVSAKPSERNNKPVAGGTRGDNTSLGQEEYHPKDFRNKMLFNKKRIQRVEMSEVLKRK